MKKVKVLIIDDSALTRSILSELIGSDKRIEIVGTAYDPIMALEKIPKLNPDVLTLDLVMPKMNGITFLKKLSAENPIPTIVISGNSPKDSSNAIQALESGAIEIIEKPDISSEEKYNEVKQLICDSIIAASLSKKAAIKDHCFKFPSKKRRHSQHRNLSSSQFYVIGASTGGPNLLRNLFSEVNSTVKKGFVVAQHMPAGFTKSFAERTNDESDLYVVESKDLEKIENGKVIIIPGNYHGVVKKNETGYYIKLTNSEKVNRHRPSVDVLFESAAKVAGSAATGIILTGMGDDGARGLKMLRDAGSKTMAQDENSCIVFGMPKAARDIGAVQLEVSPLQMVGIFNQYG